MVILAILEDLVSMLKVFELVGGAHPTWLNALRHSLTGGNVSLRVRVQLIDVVHAGLSVFYLP